MTTATRVVPGPGQESVWDYPRPPRLEPCLRRARVEFAGETIADSVAAYRILETSQPPGIYFPPQDIRMDLLRSSDGSTYCEWKGRAAYRDIVVGDRVAEQAAWTYPRPNGPFAEIEGFCSFYPARIDACFLDEELVTAQEGDYYGGWITADIVGPFKGARGTWSW